MKKMKIQLPALRQHVGRTAPRRIVFMFAVMAFAAGTQRTYSAAPSSDVIQSPSVVTDIAAAFYARPTASNVAENSTNSKEPILAGVPLAQNPLILRGQYLARLGDCIGCHTRPGGLAFAGGLPLQTPFGTIVSTNITPHKTAGIGNYSLHKFDLALRHGLDEEGRNLYPAMPYANYARLADDDLAALFTYFMQAVPPVKQENAKTNLPWPLSMRSLVKGWNWLYLPKKPYEADAAQSAEWNRGAYLVQGLGHCGACHTPRGLAGAEKASTEKGGSAFLSGAVIDGWYAQPLRSSNNTDNKPKPGLANWSVTDITDFLKTGRSQHTAAFGAMADVVSNSTQHMNGEDLAAIARYLKSIGNDSNFSNTTATEFTTPLAAANSIDATTAALRAGNVSARGALIYLDNCSACHRSDGRGAKQTFPTLTNSSTVAAEDPTSLIRIVLQGAAMPYTKQAPSELAMPQFAWRLSDDEVANVLTFVRAGWSNAAAPVSSTQVAKVRAAIKKSAEADAKKSP